VARAVRSVFVRSIYWIVLLASAGVLFVCVWILLPPSHIRLLPLAVGAPELSPLFLGAALALIAVSGLYARLLGTARLALILSLVAGCLAAWPLLRLPATLARFDRDMAALVRHDVTGRAVSFGRMVGREEPANTRVIEGVTFSSPGGSPLKLDIYLPRSAGPFPVVIQVYGGGWQFGSRTDLPWAAAELARRGFAVVAIDYRHAPEWKWPAAEEDVRRSVEWVQSHASQFDGDPARIALLGRSSGAQLSLVAAYRPPRPAIKAVVDIYGPVDFAAGWRHPPNPDPLRIRGILERFLGGTPDAVPRTYADASPISHVSKDAPPTLMIYGARDHVVEVRFGRELDRALKKAGVPSVLLELPWSEHGFDEVRNGLAAQIEMFYVEQFLNWALRARETAPSAGVR